MIYIHFRSVAELVDRKGKVTVGLDVRHQGVLMRLERPFDTVDGALSVKIALLVVAGQYDSR